MYRDIEYLLRDACSELGVADVDSVTASGIMEVDGAAIRVGSAVSGHSIALAAILAPPQNSVVPHEWLDEQMLQHAFRTFDDPEEIRFSRPPGDVQFVAATLLISREGIESGRELLGILRSFYELAQDRLIDLCTFSLATNFESGYADDNEEDEESVHFVQRRNGVAGLHICSDWEQVV